MDGPRCWNCRMAQPHVSGPYRNTHCVYCGADLGRPPVAGPVRWVATRPAGAPPARRPQVTAPYPGPPRYRDRPQWGFVPSIWRTRDTATPTPPAPGRELRSAALFARAAGVICLLAAGFEGWRFVLLIRGRTQVLSASEVRLDDALVTAAGWAALMMALVTVATLVPAVLRLQRHAEARAGVAGSRSGRQRLLMLLVPGWNLYGAGAVLAEIDALLALDPPVAPPPPVRGPMRWRSRELPTVVQDVPAAPILDAPAATPDPQHLRPGRLVSWWWLVWVLNGLVAAWALIRALIPGSLQVTADLVQVHVVLDLLAAAVAFLTVAVLRRWGRLLFPPTEGWPAGWVLQQTLQPVGSGPAPTPATEASSG